MQTLDLHRSQLNQSSQGGFAFPIAFGLTHLIVGGLALVLPQEQAGLALLFQGIVATPLSFWIARLAHAETDKNNPLDHLSIYLASAQIPAIVAYILVYNIRIEYLPAIFTIVGATHFIPYAWLHMSRIWLYLSAAMTVVPFWLVIQMKQSSFYVIPFIVGLLLLATGIGVYVQARNRASAKLPNASR